MDPLQIVLIALFLLAMTALICAAAGYRLGRSKRYQRAGFWLGMLLGPLGLVLLIMLPPAADLGRDAQSGTFCSRS